MPGSLIRDSIKKVLKGVKDPKYKENKPLKAYFEWWLGLLDCFVVPIDFQ